MLLRRLVVIVPSVVGAVLLAIVLYLAFVDLGRHKSRIEAFVTEQTGRAFTIDGALELKVLPSVSVLAERVRFGNAQWGSKPQMVEIGRVATNIGLWSLISGPVDIHSFEFSDVSVLLEKNRDGTGNWAFGGEPAPEDATSPDSGAPEVPAVIQYAKLSNVKITYREPGKPDRVALLETLTIEPGTDGLLAISGKGRVDDYRTSLEGHVGPIDALFSGRNIRMAIQGAIEKLRLDINGSLGRLDPLTGADLVLKLEHPDLGRMLKNLRLPAVATGPLSVDAQLKDAGKLTQLDLDAKLGDITAKTHGTLRTLGLPDSDLRFEVSIPDVARLASAFDVAGLPAEALKVSGRVASSRKEVKLDGLSATLAGAQVKADGTIRLARDRDAEIRFELGVENLMRLRQGLPEIPFSMSGNFLESRDKFELQDLTSRVGETEISGWASMVRNGKRHVEAELASPRLDLTRLSTKETDSKAKTQSTIGASAPPAKQTAKAPKGQYVFSEAPMALDKLPRADAKLHFVATEVKLAAGTLKDVDGTLIVDVGQLAFEGRARGGIDGTLNGAIKLKSTSDGAADLKLNFAAKDLRAGVVAGDAIDPRLAPPTSIEANLQASGVSARQLVSSANGQVLLTQGPGKTRSGLLGMFGGDLFAQLASKLNPFAAQDPYTQLDCTVARVDIVDGRATVAPVLMQSKKVTITASGKVDLHTEVLTVDFNTRPREGIGVSPGMFTNPFIKLEGTLASPRLGIGAKGAASGAVAAATAGASVLAKGLVDRARGEADLCKKTLEKVTRPAVLAEVRSSS